MPITVFIDSDVLISSLLSSRGAAYQLLSTSYITKYISTISEKEIYTVIPRLEISKEKTAAHIRTHCKIIDIGIEMHRVEPLYKKYITDSDDAHIVAGSVRAKASFLITYNVKDFLRDSIKQDFSIICMTPGNFLQYLRSIE